MDNIGKMFEQVAAEAGCTANKAKVAVYLSQLAAGGRTLRGAAASLNRKPETIKVLAREFLIDFPDYRPFERMEKAGKARPEPKYRLTA